MNSFPVFVFLVVATGLEASGDAIIRIGLSQDANGPRLALFAAGAALLFGYGVFLNLAPIEFGRVVGLYIAILFVMWQAINLIAFRTIPTMGVLVGGAMIVAGGAIVTYWRV